MFHTHPEAMGLMMFMDKRDLYWRSVTPQRNTVYRVNRVTL